MHPLTRAPRDGPPKRAQGACAIAMISMSACSSEANSLLLVLRRSPSQFCPAEHADVACSPQP